MKLHKISSTKIILKFTFILLFFVFASCNEEKELIPNVYVDFQIDLNDPEYKDLNVTGGYINVTGGHRGILIYRRSFDEFSAYDRACPYDPECGYVSADESVFLAVDTVCCKSEFALTLNGAVTTGPAQFPLRNYSVQYNSSTNLIRVTN